MNSHPYLRAYLAGTFIPTLVLPLWLIAFIISRIVLHAQVPIEQAMTLTLADLKAKGVFASSVKAEPIVTNVAPPYLQATLEPAASPTPTAK